MKHNKWDLNEVESEFIRDEIRKCNYSNPEDRLYVGDLLDLEHWIKDGDDNRNHVGMHIPYFSQSHSTQVIVRRKREHRKILSELKGKGAYEEWYIREHSSEWYTKKSYYSDNMELLNEKNIRRIGPKSFLFYACNECKQKWAVVPKHNGIYARKGIKPWWECPDGCNSTSSSNIKLRERGDNYPEILNLASFQIPK